MKDSLKPIMVADKVAKILSKVVFILCIVGAAGCLVGLVTLLAVSGITYDGKTVAQYIEENSKTTMPNIYQALVVGALYCGAEIPAARLGFLYFSRVENDGTPFTKDGAKQAFILGIVLLAIGVACSLFVSIAHGIFSLNFSGIEKVDSEIGSFGVGAFFLLLAAIFNHGADLKQASEESKAE